MRAGVLKIDQGLEKAERMTACGLYVLLIAAVSINVFARNVLHTGSPFLLENSPTLVLWLALVGATLGLKHRRHITVGALLRLVPPHRRRPAERLINAAAMAVSAILGYAAISFVQSEIVLFGAWGWRAACFPLFFSIIFFRSALRLTAGGR